MARLGFIFLPTYTVALEFEPTSVSRFDIFEWHTTDWATAAQHLSKHDFFFSDYGEDRGDVGVNVDVGVGNYRKLDNIPYFSILTYSIALSCLAVMGSNLVYRNYHKILLIYLKGL